MGNNGGEEGGVSDLSEALRLLQLFREVGAAMNRAAAEDGRGVRRCRRAAGETRAAEGNRAGAARPRTCGAAG